jgi:Domain of unknown function (DUF4062)
MARPRVFVSSTYYDLKHLRSSIENFIEQLGYEPVLSEKDSIAYLPDAPLDESCYREAKSADIFVLIVGGRYGSRTSDSSSMTDGFYDRYQSITRQEFESAKERDIPTYILIDSAVDAEYQTFLKNKTNEKINYAHVDSVNVFHFIESIREKSNNNPIKLFNKYSDIESWLREQWAGNFRELIQRMSTGSRIQDIDNKVADLAQTTQTLKIYLEELVKNTTVEKKHALQIITEENDRLKKFKIDFDLKSIGYLNHLENSHEISIESARIALVNNNTFESLLKNIFSETLHRSRCACHNRSFNDINAARLLLNLPPYEEAELQYARKNLNENVFSRQVYERDFKPTKAQASVARLNVTKEADEAIVMLKKKNIRKST